MSLWYIDTSAAMKLLVTEAETEPLTAAILGQKPDFVACYLLETEMRRAAARIPGLTQSDVVVLLDSVALHEVPASLFREAGILPGKHLRSLDAIHVAAAIRIGVDCIVTYDSRMMDTAYALGVRVIAPGASDPPLHPHF